MSKEPVSHQSSASMSFETVALFRSARMRTFVLTSNWTYLGRLKRCDHTDVPHFGSAQVGGDQKPVGLPGLLRLGKADFALIGGPAIEVRPETVARQAHASRCPQRRQETSFRGILLQPQDSVAVGLMSRTGSAAEMLVQASLCLCQHSDPTSRLS